MKTPKKRGLGLGAHQGTVAAALNASDAQVEEPRSKRRIALPDDVPMSIRLPKVAHQELRRLAYEEEIPIHTMILDGIRMFLQSKGINSAME